MKKVLIATLIMLLSVGLSFAHGTGFGEADELIASEAPCDQLTEEQLELIGDYIMEQMHSREQHERMDEMIGGEGSESLKQAHINMANRFYCNQNTGTLGMMGNYGIVHPLSIFYLILLIGIIIITYLYWKKKNKKRRKKKSKKYTK